jgi:hypothetical protein
LWVKVSFTVTTALLPNDDSSHVSPCRQYPITSRDYSFHVSAIFFSSRLKDDVIMSGGGDEVQSLLKAIRGKMIVLQMKCRNGVILNL